MYHCVCIHIVYIHESYLPGPVPELSAIVENQRRVPLTHELQPAAPTRPPAVLNHHPSHLSRERAPHPRLLLAPAMRVLQQAHISEGWREDGELG